MSFNFLDKIFETIPGPPKSDNNTTKDAKTPNRVKKSKIAKKLKDEKLEMTAIKIHDPFTRAYDCLKGVIQKNHGLNQITNLASNRGRAIKKLKNKHFMLTKNEVKRGKKHPSSKKKVASRKVQRQKALFELKYVNYSDIQPLTQVWKDYIKELLYEQKDMWTGKLKDPSQTEFLRIMRASYHMATLTVNQKGSPPFEGIVLKETLSTFHMITSDNKHKQIVKAHSVFEFDIEDRRFRIVGASLGYRSEERIRVKWKLRNWTQYIDGIVGLDGELINN